MGSLVLDEMSIRPGTFYQRQADEIHGLVSFPNEEQSCEPEVATHLLCFVFVGLSTHYRYSFMPASHEIFVYSLSLLQTPCWIFLHEGTCSTTVAQNCTGSSAECGTVGLHSCPHCCRQSCHQQEIFLNPVQRSHTCCYQVCKDYSRVWKRF